MLHRVIYFKVMPRKVSLTPLHLGFQHLVVVNAGVNYSSQHYPLKVTYPYL